MRKEYPLKIERIDDGEIFSINLDDFTYTMDQNRISMPTCFYRYSYERLVEQEPDVFREVKGWKLVNEL